MKLYYLTIRLNQYKIDEIKVERETPKKLHLSLYMGMKKKLQKHLVGYMGRDQGFFYSPEQAIQMAQEKLIKEQNKLNERKTSLIKLFNQYK